MFVSGMLAAILGYAFQVILGRLLTPQEYASFTALLAMTIIASVPFGAVSMVISRQASGYYAISDKEGLSAYCHSSNWYLARLGGGFAVFGVIASPYIRDYFHLESVVPVLILLPSFFFYFLALTNGAILQALQRFNWISANAVVGALSKMFLCVALVFFGFGLNGALLGMSLTAVVTWFVNYLPMRELVSKSLSGVRPALQFSLKSTLPVVYANLAFAVMTQLDFILVNRYFSGHDAGIYVAAAVLGKAIMYLPGAIVQALFPLVAENEALQRSSAHLFFRALLLTLGLGSAGALLYFLFSNEIMELLYGQRYVGSANLLQYMGFAMLPMALITVAEHFLIAKKRVLFAYLMMSVAPIQIGLIARYHNSLMDVIWIISGCGWGLVIVGFGILGWQYVRSVVAQP